MSRKPAALSAGVDEAGRGPLAGPVVVAAVVLDPEDPIPGLADSKRLTARRRERLADAIRLRALAWSVVPCGPERIDQVNIYQATMQAMCTAITLLPVRPGEVLVDGNRVPSGVDLPARALVGGDGIEPAISAASILAKVWRDAWMSALDQRYPQYGFARHKGYPTREHIQALRRLGPCPEHRRSFAPVRKSMSIQELELDF
ncbi:MAG: ribonuclease HII [Ectothiorhodospiraceae bacterium]|nr:ribonuclease HII [Ectothiorhodospiraceae bacterium]